MLVDAGIMKY